MKKRFCAFALCAMLLLSMAAPALAAEGDFGFYDLGTAEGVTLTPLTASGEEVEAVSQDVDGVAGDETFYPGSSALRVTLSETEQGALYLLTVSSGEDILYADQREGGGELRFSISFPLPEEQTEYLLHIGGSAAGFVKITIPFSYTPKAEAAPGNPTQPKDADEQPDPEKDPEKGQEPEPTPAVTFSDIDEEAWYFEGVSWASSNGIMTGVGDGKFDPTGVTSRAMLVTMLWRMEGEPETEYNMTFADVPDGTWYTKAVRWAAANGIVGGYSAEQFGPSDSVSREQLATILWRYASYMGADMSAGEAFNLGIFVDAEYISGWAWDAMRWAAGVGLINGVGNERISPETDASRAQVATILMRYHANR